MRQNLVTAVAICFMERHPQRKPYSRLDDSTYMFFFGSCRALPLHSCSGTASAKFADSAVQLEENTRCKMKRQPVRFCDGCGQMFDAIQPQGGQAQWIEARAYLMKYGLHWDDLDRIDDACPSCARVFQAAAHHAEASRKETLPS